MKPRFRLLCIGIFPGDSSPTWAMFPVENMRKAYEIVTNDRIKLAYGENADYIQKLRIQQLKNTLGYFAGEPEIRPTLFPQNQFLVE